MTVMDKNFDYCHKIMKKYSKSFSYAFDLLPKSQRRAVWAIYAVCRKIDDSIDVYRDIQFLNQIKSDIELIDQFPYKHHRFQSDKRIMCALQDVAKQYDLSYQSFYNLIDTVYEDETFIMFDTDEDLLHYCYGVAGTVGEVLTPILSEQPTAHTYDIARQLGESLQLVNILRDVGEDFANGRVYFSKQCLHQFNVSMAYQYHQQITDNYIELWECYAKIAEEDYRNVMAHIEVFSIEAQQVVELAAVIYHAILDEVRKAEYTLHERVYVPKNKKAKLYQQVKHKYKNS